MFIRVYILFFSLIFLQLFSQNRKQYKVYYDSENKQIKEQYHTLISDTTVLDGLYKTYYQDGKVKTVGFYTKGLATDYWEYFYQNGNLKMEGLINNFFNQGHWIFYYESGKKSMEGNMEKGKKNGFWRFYTEDATLKSEGNILNDKNDGNWKYYHEDGTIKASARYTKGEGIYSEYYPDGTIKMQGKIKNGKSDSLWTYYHTNGNIKSSGYEINGFKEKAWKFYFFNGSLASEGEYKKGQTIGNWKYYYENGKIKAEGAEKDGKRDGHWLMYNEDGKPKAEGFYVLGSGEYFEYHPNGKIKAKGNVLDGKYDGMWDFYQENSFFKEGNCNYSNGEGWYSGFYPDGKKKTEGLLKNGVKSGIWRLYKTDGTLAGYYKNADVDEELILPQISKTVPNTAIKNSFSTKKKKSFFNKIHLYRPDPNVYKTFILSLDPIQFLSGAIPISVEYYVQKKWGLELVYAYFRNPFFSSLAKTANRDVFSSGSGYSIRYKKYFSNSEFIGNPYIGGEYRYKKIAYNSHYEDSTMLNKTEILTLTENAHEVLLILGDRFMKSNTKGGPTIDVYLGIGAGYRFLNTNFVSTPEKDATFNNSIKNGWYVPFRFGVNIGWAF
ncbi:MAG: toxin-antitoxin system YwqK family antitoxin [Bacteroidetes bacterium]|nr:MAG: toxin-antitoxin system YwqK family antitoxin [Bacteroidota bacterium]